MWPTLTNLLNIHSQPQNFGMCCCCSIFLPNCTEKNPHIKFLNLKDFKIFLIPRTIQHTYWSIQLRLVFCVGPVHCS